jgi:hypothetical protein
MRLRASVRASVIATSGPTLYGELLFKCSGAGLCFDAFSVPHRFSSSSDKVVKPKIDSWHP